jgi:ketosteroid isomerase-like protein
LPIALYNFVEKASFDKAQNELFSKDAVSIEPHSTPAFEKETKGLKAIKDKAKKWEDMVEKTHHVDVSEPIVSNNSFACTMRMHVTMKEKGEMDMTELCVYSTKDGKIVKEEFFM